MKTNRIIASLGLALWLLCQNASATTTNYQDAWWNPDQSGMGLLIIQQGTTVSASWFHYDSDGRATFLTLAGTLVGTTVASPLWRTTGPQPGAGYNPANVATQEVGNATLTFSGDNSATLTYNYDGLSGSIPLVRFSFTAPSLSGSWIYGAKGTVSQCSNTAYNETFTAGGTISISQTSSSLGVTFRSSSGGSCTVALTPTQTGSVLSGSGTFTCSNGTRGNASISEARVVDNFLTMRYDARYTNFFDCVESGLFGAIKN